MKKYYFLFFIFIISYSAQSKSFDNKGFKEINIFLDSLSKYNPQACYDLLTSDVDFDDYNDTIKIYLYYYKGNSGLLIGENAQSDISYYKALELAKKINLRKPIAAVYQSLGVLYNNVSDYDKSDECSNNALAIYEEMRDSSGITDICINKGTIEIEKEHYDNSLKYFFKALEYSTNNDQVIMINNNIGEVYLLQKEYDKAKEFYLNAYNYCLDCELPRLKAVLNLNLADLYFIQNNIDSASVLIVEALKLIDIHSYVALKPSALHVYSKILQKQNRLEESHEVYRQYVKLDDSINSIQNFNEFYQAENSRLISKQEEEITYIENQYKKWDWGLYILILIFLLALVVAIFYIKRQVATLEKSRHKVDVEAVKNNNLLEEIEYKDKEIENFAHHISIKNNLLEELKINISKSDNGGKEIKELINKNLNLEKDRKEFYLKIDKLKDAFFLKLKKEYPELTERDLQFSALLVVGMSSKEISDTLFISLEGVKKGRYRLRKKMNLVTSVNLMTHLKSF